MEAAGRRRGRLRSSSWLLISLFILTPKYEATAKLYVMSRTDSAVNISDLQIGSYLTSDYQEVFKTWEVHEQVLQNLGLDYDYEQLEEMLTVTNPCRHAHTRDHRDLRRSRGSDG